METYSRVASLSIGKESSENVAVTPTVFIPFNDENISLDFAYQAAVPVSSSRSVNRRAIKKRIPSPNGSINVNVEPNTFGHFLEAIYGDLASGNHIDISGITGTFQVGETITGGTSTETATVAFVGDDFLIITSPSGAFTNGETITGGTSSATATLGTYNASGYGHAANLPAEHSNTYCLQLNYSDRAYRLTGVKFTSIDALGQSDDIITAGISLMARGVFRQARVTATTTAGAGSKSIFLDQTLGLVVGDTIKVWRKGTGFLDFSASSVKTHTVDTVVANTRITVTNTQTQLSAGDIILLAPQTASYSIDEEFPWVGGSQISLGDDVDNFATEEAEDFSLVVTNDYEERHAAKSTGIQNRFPSALLHKGITATGNFTLYNQDEGFMQIARENRAQAIKIRSIGTAVVTNKNHQLEFILPNIQFGSYNQNISQDDIVNENVPFDAFHDETEGYISQVLLVNGIASY